MKLTFDETSNALYIELADGASVESIAIDEGTLVDLDARGGVVGIEVRDPGRNWPVDEILRRFDLRPVDIEVLRSVWPADGARHATFPFALARRS